MEDHQEHTPALGNRGPFVDVLLKRTPVAIRAVFPESEVPPGRECKTFADLGATLRELTEQADFKGKLELDYLAPRQEGKPPYVERIVFLYACGSEIQVTDTKIVITHPDTTFTEVRFHKKTGLKPVFKQEDLARFRC